MPAASMPTMDGVNSTSGHLKRSEPMVITCTKTCRVSRSMGQGGAQVRLHADYSLTKLCHNPQPHPWVGAPCSPHWQEVMQGVLHAWLDRRASSMTVSCKASLRPQTQECSSS